MQKDMMKTSLLIFGCAVVVLTVFVTCTDQGINSDHIISTFPLQVGNRWVYEYNYSLVSLNNVADTLLSRSMIYRRVIGIDDTLLSRSLTVVDDSVVSQDGLEPYFKRYWLAISGNELIEYAHWFYMASTPDTNIVINDTANSTWLIFPLEEGRTWQYSGFFNDNSSGTTKTVEMLTEKNFNQKAVFCGQIRAESPLFHDKYWNEWYSNDGYLGMEFDHGLETRWDPETGQRIPIHVFEETHLVDMSL